MIIIPKSSEDDLFAHLDGFCEANGMFGKIAASALAKGTPLTEEPALASMFARKYANPEVSPPCILSLGFFATLVRFGSVVVV